MNRTVRRMKIRIEPDMSEAKIIVMFFSALKHPARCLTLNSIIWKLIQIISNNCQALAPNPDPAEQPTHLAFKDD